MYDVYICFFFFFFFKQKTAYEIRLSLVGSEDVYKRQGAKSSADALGEAQSAADRLLKAYR